MQEHFEDVDAEPAGEPPVVKAQVRPTREELDDYQATHARYMPWCRHCNAARVVRHKHPSKGRQAAIVPDTDAKVQGPTKISLDYMYLHERADTHLEHKYNPPHLVMVEHKRGRVWAHRVLNKGASGEAAWLPKKIVQDWDSCGMKDFTIQLK